MLSTSAWCSMPSAVEALPCGSMSMTRTFSPAAARAAAMLTVVVVLPTPPFWLETVKIRVFSGFGRSRPRRRSRRLFSWASSRAMGLESSMVSMTLPLQLLFHVKPWRHGACNRIQVILQSPWRPVTRQTARADPKDTNGGIRCVEVSLLVTGTHSLSFGFRCRSLA